MTVPVTVTAPAPRPQRHLTLRGEEIPVILPNPRDPRLKLSAVVVTIHVLGQTVLDFKVSIAQILVSMLVCGLVEGITTFRNTRTLAWPASGLLTGSSIALILRASGTAHGDYWSLHGIEFFLMADAVALLSKHFIRPTGRHLFNPSNVGIVWCLLVVGPNHVFAQYLWWGPSILGQVLAYAVILVGGLWVLRAVRMVPMVTAFMVTFGVLIGLFALGGREFIAIWHENGPVAGMEYWVNVAFSPEILVFVFFMISDPVTAAKAPAARLVYGAGVAVAAAALIFFQHTEFGIKVSILSSLTVLTAAVPLIEPAVRRWRARAEAAAGDAPAEVSVPQRVRVLQKVRRPAVAAALIIALAAPVDTALFSRNKQVVLIERGQVGKANAQ